VDNKQTSVLELHRHHFQSDAVCVVAQIDEPRFGTGGSTCRRRLLETKTAMLNDVARAFTSYPMLGCRASPSEIHTSSLAILSDNISRRAASSDLDVMRRKGRDRPPSLPLLSKPLTRCARRSSVAGESRGESGSSGALLGGAFRAVRFDPYARHVRSEPHSLLYEAAFSFVDALTRVAQPLQVLVDRFDSLPRLNVTEGVAPLLPSLQDR
jgi:hypothetical protein